MYIEQTDCTAGLDRPQARLYTVQGRAPLGVFTLCVHHGRRIKTEENAEVVASVLGEEFIKFLAALAVCLGRF